MGHERNAKGTGTVLVLVALVLAATTFTGCSPGSADGSEPHPDSGPAGGNRAVDTVPDAPGVTFAPDLDGDRLVAEHTGGRGETEFRLPVLPREATLTLAALCRTEVSGAQLLVSTPVSEGTEQGYPVARCGPGDDLQRVVGFRSDRIPARRTTTVRVRLATADGHQVSDPAARIALGVYEHSAPRRVVDDVVLRERLRIHGLEYRLTDVASGSRRVSMDVPAGRSPAVILVDTSATMHLSRAGQRLHLLVDGREEYVRPMSGVRYGMTPLLDAGAHRVMARDDGFSDRGLVMSCYLPVLPELPLPRRPGPETRRSSTASEA